MRVIVCCLLVFPVWSQVSVTTGQYSTSRTNANTSETVLTQTTAKSLGQICSMAITGMTISQPLIVSGVSISGATSVAMISTLTNDVYLFNARTCAQIWHVNLGTPEANEDDNIPGDFFGCLSTGVIDTGTNVIYLSCNLNSTGWTVFALNLTDGSTAHSAVTVSGTSKGVTFVSSDVLQRPALLLAAGNVYLGFGSHEDINPWTGWLIAYSESSLSQTAILAMANTNDPQGSNGAAIWQGGMGPALDGSGNIYVITGNGDWDGTTNFGESFVKLNSSLVEQDYSTPANWTTLNTEDKDLGSSGPMLIGSFVIGGGKDARLWLLNQSNLGQLQGSGPGPVQVFSVSGGLWGGQAFANNILYVSGTGATSAYSFSGSTFTTTPVATGPIAGFQSTVAYSSNGSTAGTGLLWVLFSAQNDIGTDCGGVTPTIMEVLNPSTLAVINTVQVANYCKFATPTVANGLVYVNTLAGATQVFGAAGTTVNGNVTLNGGVTLQ